MFKVHVFLDGVEDPFAHRGAVAAEALTATAPDAVAYTQSRRTAEQLWTLSCRAR